MFALLAMPTVASGTMLAGALAAASAADPKDGASLTADVGKFAWLAGHTHGMHARAAQTRGDASSS
jgi:hypothetical protein